MIRHFCVVTTLALLCGCQPDTTTKEDADAGDRARFAERSPASQSRDRASPNESAHQAVTGFAKKPSSQLSFGRITFAKPPGWESGESNSTTDFVRFFAPDPSRWKKSGVRPNLGVRKRPHPGVTLERFQQMLEQMLSQSTDQLNEHFNQHAQVSERGGAKVSMMEKPIYTFAIREFDGTKVIVSSCRALFQVPTGSVLAKTWSMNILCSDALYTIFLTFPEEAEKEMDRIWQSFEADVHIND